MNSEALEMFLEEVNEELKTRNIRKGEFAKAALGNSITLNTLKQRGSCSTRVLEKIVDELDMRLIICLGDKDE